jgi:DNA-binding CsgD family transcriptional regulator/tetratricopeptide (TPR) repeat protein
MALLERHGLLAQLRAQWDAACAGQGRLVFVEGEAGIGKTKLLRAFAQTLKTEAPVHWGACEALITPRPLGPLHDIAFAAGGELRAMLDGDAERHRLFVAFIDLLAQRSSLVIFEDLHWADEATLDLLRFAGRRIVHTRSLMVASFRSDELLPAHPLRVVLGDLSTVAALRLAPQALSLDAVRSLCGEGNVDAVALHRKTGGNPFFVTEVLAADDHGVPASVQDAVLARAARLSTAARMVLDAAAVAGPRVEPWLLRELTATATATESASIDECLATGVLRADNTLFAFRHELARQAILQAMTPTRAASLHRLVLQALLSHAVCVADAARLAHHAAGADDAQAVQQWAPVAAREAVARGAHRQAVEHWASALEHTQSPAARAQLLDEFSFEVQICGGVNEAIAARQEAARLWREIGQRDNAAASLAQLSLLYVLRGRNDEGEETMRQARALIGEDSKSPAAFLVQRYAAGLRMLDRDCDAAIALATPALAEAERTSDGAATVENLSTIGAAMLACGRIEEGISHLERSLALAQHMHRDRAVAQALANLGSGCGEALRLDLAVGYLRRGIAFGAERDLDATRHYQTAWLALVRLMQGHWDEASSAAQEVIADGRATTIARIMALIALGKLRARRGDPGVWVALDEAQALATTTGTAQRVVPMRAARAEAAWLEARAEDAAREAAMDLPLAMAKRQAGFAAELVLWCRRGGAETAIPAFCNSHPCALEAAGRWFEAAQAWRALGCPFDAARALSDGDENAQREALVIFESLGARPMIERLRHRLRAAGVRGLRHGPRSSTRQHPSGLTDKEMRVLLLLAGGLRNKEIALRLSRSARTIDHHLQAVFAKLGVSTRAEAVSTAYRMGIASAQEDRPRD